MERQTISVKETAAALGVSVDAVYDAVARQELASIRLGGRVLIPVAAITDLVAGATKGKG